MTIVSCFQSFPNIAWWASVMKADHVILDKAEHFQKMSYRNRYRISGANNPVLLTVPLVSGRNQRTAMKDVRIFNDSAWQTQHWRTLVSVYNRTPYFGHYADSLKPLFETEFDLLVDFNRMSIHWVRQQLGGRFTTEETDVFVKEYPAEIDDNRNLDEGNDPMLFPKYYQVFEDSIGFVPNLSILDLLFSEGPGAKRLLNS